MFGLICRGLHCAGCGKGIPASIAWLLIAFVLFSAKSTDHAMNNLFNALAWLVVSVAIAGPVIFGITVWIMQRIMRSGRMIFMARMDEPSFTAQKEWFERANIEGQQHYLRAIPRERAAIMNRPEYLTNERPEYEVIYRED